MNRLRTYNGRLPALSLLLLLSVTGALPGKDKWAKKSYLEWTEEEALQVLTGSPWSKTWSKAAVPRPSPGTATSSVETGDSGQHSNCCRTFGSGIGTAAADPRNTKEIVAGGQHTTSSGVLGGESFRIVWFSSMRVRQALYRLRLINGAERDPAAESQLVRPADRIVLAISGPFMHRFQGTSLDQLRASTHLESRKNRGRVVELQAFVAPETRPDRLTLFIFERSVAGRPLFGAEDKEIIFSSGEGSERIAVAFKLESMAVDGGLDY